MNNNSDEIKRILEALLFSAHEPVPAKKLRDVVAEEHEVNSKEVRELLDELREEYNIEERTWQLDEIAEGYQLRSREAYSPYVQRLHLGRRAERISPASTEVLAIIAYRQPITRPILDAIRGVDSSGCVHALLERELIAVVGKLDAPGKPSLYGTTQKFLQYFGLKSLKDLPKSEELGPRKEAAEPAEVEEMQVVEPKSNTIDLS